MFFKSKPSFFVGSEQLSELQYVPDGDVYKLKLVPIDENVKHLLKPSDCDLEKLFQAGINPEFVNSSGLIGRLSDVDAEAQIRSIIEKINNDNSNV